MLKNDFGVFELLIPLKKDGSLPIPHDSKVKVSFVRNESDERLERIPAWITRATQDLSHSPVFDGIFWSPEEKYEFRNKMNQVPQDLRIYESHSTFSLSFYFYLG